MGRLKVVGLDLYLATSPMTTSIRAKTGYTFPPSIIVFVAIPLHPSLEFA